ncbi:MAG: YchF/TatD family DNA exonuclease [Magnetococcales bacterium]|nr:YchF/TatD family DNA exonuclease [Magnetococcales bacterium]
MILTDSHAHLDFPDYDHDLPEVLERAEQAQIGFINTIATRLGQAAYLRQLTARWSGMVGSIGVHPHYTSEAPVTEADLTAACRQAGPIVALGETGLDFHYQFSDRQHQIDSFRLHIRTAQALGLPLIVHSREAEAETMAIMEQEQAWRCGAVLHCFTASDAMARWAVERGFYLSFSGVVTFKTADTLRQTAAWIPSDRLLIETDCPYLSPIPHRGKRNEPAYVVHTAAVLAEVRHQDLTTIADCTTSNFQQLFRIAPASSSSETLAYTIGDGLYLNVTHGCTLHCQFCPKWTAPIVHHYDLSLRRNPSVQQLLTAIEQVSEGDISRYHEIVFCGYGESTLRLNVLLEVAAEVKRRGGRRVRINTDGLANRVYGRDVTPQFRGLIDAISISLNAQDEETYNRHCQPALSGSYAAMLAFVEAVRQHVPEVTLTAIRGLPGVDIDACRRIADTLGVHFRMRILHQLG